ncbi:MAG: sulfatase-like hydrolase/transferase, partial [Candidatus Eisenbacteria bacterium]|nr:sulfatase-like hydrolase/transferase [Candidatus Eisenbacteria bacterium]
MIDRAAHSSASKPAIFAGAALCLAAAWLTFLAGCGGGTGQPNAVLIILDTTRADALGVYGSQTARTPNLDRLARTGLLFRETTAQNPYTMGSIATIFTSLGPEVHRIRSNSGFKLDEAALTIAEVFRDAGYATAGFVSAFPVKSETGLAQGFAVYDDDLSMEFPVYDPQFLPVQESRRGAERRGDVTVERALRWLEGSRPRNKPFFLMVHLFDPHQPYDPPPPYDEMFLGNPYAGEIAFSDALVGRILDQLDERDLTSSTFVAVVSDHGEAFGEHNEFTHGFLLYETTLHVPWILAGPGVPPGVVTGTTALMDVAPTLLAACGLTPPATSQGLDLLTPLSAPGQEVWEAPSRGIYCDTYFPRLTHKW